MNGGGGHLWRFLTKVIRKKFHFSCARTGSFLGGQSTTMQKRFGLNASNPKNLKPRPLLHTVGFWCCSVVEPLFFHAIAFWPFALLVAPFFTSAVAPGAKLSRPRHHALGGTSLAPRQERIAKPATPRPVLRPLRKAQGQRCGTRRHLRRLPRTEHPPQPAGGPRRRSLGAVGSTRQGWG